MTHSEDHLRQTTTDQEDEDPFLSLLNLEDKFYREGHSEGVSDGACAGLLEGRAFGLEKGFERYLTMGRLHGRAVVWAGRLHKQQNPPPERAVDSNGESTEQGVGMLQGTPLSSRHPQLPALPANPRLEKHIKTLYHLTEPATLSMQNTEDSVSDFDDRLKRAVAKMKVIEKLIGESEVSRGHDSGEQGRKREKGGGEGSIEDVSSLRVRI